MWSVLAKDEYPSCELSSANLCMQKMWRYFPSSFLLPSTITPLFLDSFDTPLPFYISTFDDNEVVIPESELNKTCHFVVDVRYEDQQDTDYVEWTYPPLDAEETKPPLPDWSLLWTTDIVDVDKSAPVVRYFVVPECLGYHTTLYDAASVLLRNTPAVKRDSNKKN